MFWWFLKKAMPLLGVLCLAMASGAPVVSAQSSAGPQQSAAQINDRELRAFARAYVETQNIRRKYEPPIEKSSDPDRTRRLHQSANEELKSALARNDLTVEQYNRIFARVNSDKQLREKILEMVEEERKSSPKKQPQSR